MQVDDALLQVYLLYEVIFYVVSSNKIYFVLYLEFYVKFILLYKLARLALLLLKRFGCFFSHQAFLVHFIGLKKPIEISFNPRYELSKSYLLLAQRFHP